MVALTPTSAAASQGPRGDSHFCPHCLKRIDAVDAQRRAHREACRSGPLDVSLLQCPVCGIVLAAEIDPSPAWSVATD
jgi:hypothetical protein